MLWHKLTLLSFLPIFPCKHILPILCTYWNSIQYVGDQIPQMLWLRKFHPPRLSSQICTTMKLTFYLPQYQIHRVYQLEAATNLSNIHSLKQYREKTRKTTTLFDSMKETHIIIESMIAVDDTSNLPTPSTSHTPRTSSRLLHPPAIRVKGITDISHWNALITGSTSQRYVKQFYDDELNSASTTVIHQNKTCPGNPILLVGEKGKKNKKTCCMRCGGRSLLVYCTICHHNFCFDVNQNKSTDSNMFGSIDTHMTDTNNKAI